VIVQKYPLMLFCGPSLFPLLWISPNGFGLSPLVLNGALYYILRRLFIRVGFGDLVKNYEVNGYNKLINS
jgi:hypothetical protein